MHPYLHDIPIRIRCIFSRHLDPLDRESSEADERAATMIAMQILDRSKYNPEAMLTFWQRVQQDETLQIKVKRLA